MDGDVQVLDLVRELMLKDDEISHRAADEILRLRRVIVRNCTLTPKTPSDDAVIIESLQRCEAKRA